jgi:uncharacterized protein YjbI with pentapeptide repeats
MRSDIFWPQVWKYLQPLQVKDVRPNDEASFGYDPSAGADIAERFGIRRSLYVADREFWAGAAPPESGVLKSLEADQFDLARPTLEKVSREGVGIKLRGRNLAFANFQNSKLIGADFSPNLTYQEMSNLNFTGHEDQVRPLYQSRFTNLHGVNFSGADLRGSSFVFVSAEKAFFSSADLRGARFEHAELRLSDLSLAKMQEVRLYYSDLRATYLTGANLRGARIFASNLNESFLSQAQMQGAFVEASRFQLAELDQVNLQGSYIASSNFEGAVLDGSDMSGALLSGASLQGASLKRAELRAAYFIDTEFRGVYLEEADVHYARFQEPDLDTIGSIGAANTFILGSVRRKVPELEERMKCRCAFLNVARGDNVWIDASETTVDEMLNGAISMRTQDLAKYSAHARTILLDLACGQRGPVPAYTDVSSHMAAGSTRYVARGIIEFRAHEPDPWKGLSPDDFRHLEGLAGAMLSDSCVKSNLSQDLIVELQRAQRADEERMAAGERQ